MTEDPSQQTSEETRPPDEGPPAESSEKPAAPPEPADAVGSEAAPEEQDVSDAAQPEEAAAESALEEATESGGDAESAGAEALTEEAEEPAEPQAVRSDEGDETAPEAEAPAPEAEAPADEGEEAEEESEEEEEEEDLSFRFLPGDWYVVHTYAGYENKVRANLGSRIQSMNMEDKIYDVVVPTEEVMELKSGKMQAVQKKVFPGYILVRMDLDDDSWYVVRNTPGVTGFVGTGAKPTPLDEAEVQQILAPEPDEQRRLGPQLEFEEGEVVTVTAGAFGGYSGPITEIMVDRRLVRVLLNLFGRETPVDVPLDQVEKL